VSSSTIKTLAPTRSSLGGYARTVCSLRRAGVGS
jgi:hypothetical protein